MAGNTSAIIVVMVAVCMVAVAVPAAIVATQDEGTFQVDIDISIVKDKLSKEDKTEITELLSKTFGGTWGFSSNGRHVGSNDCPDLDNIEILAFTETIKKVLKEKGLNYTIVRLDGQKIVPGETLSQYSLFKIVETPEI